MAQSSDHPSATDQDQSRDSPERDRIFVTTHWSVVLKAAKSDTTRAQEALSTLCQTYWQPLYGYVRRRGYSKEEAEDLVQGFFAKFISGNSLNTVSRDQGRFRAFLLASIKHYMANEWDRAHRQKRGGHATHFSLDWKRAEERCAAHPIDGESPDRIFDREWAMTLLDRVLEGLEDGMRKEGKEKSFQVLKAYLTVGREEIAYGDAAKALAMSEAAARVAVHRLRKRYRTLVREEIAQTLSTPDLVDEEMRSLFAALSGG